ncbi:hypothetical protein BH11MYX4_BH11MYX4_26950 [soil metagenome]
MPDHALELERLNRLYVALTHINKAIVQNRTRDGLFRSICTVLVEDGGFGMAWVGWHDPETHRLTPVAQAGDTSGYLQSVEVYADDRVEGSGPSGTAFRENRPYVCNDLVADPTTLPWRAALERAGFRASAVIPIRTNGAASGTLTVYADRPDFFRDREIALLAEAGADVSIALDVLDVEAARTRAEAAVEREQRFARGLIEAMPGIFYLYDEQGRFLRWNGGFERASGYTPDEIAQMHPLDFFPADEWAILQSRIAQVFEKGEASVEASFVSKDGSATPYFFTGKRIVFDGAPHLVGVGLDISELRRAEDALRRCEERYRTTLDTILEGGQLLGFDWRYLYLNPAAAIQNRRPNSELLGRRMPDAWPGIEATEVFALLRRCMTERVSARGEIEFPFADGAKGWFDVRAQPVPEGIFVLSIDISEHKRADNALRDLNESLERKFAERTVALAAARERAEAADRVKSSFLATMSHELRTPLNSILGFTGIVLKGMAGALNPEQSKQLGMVQSSARHLLDLINDVLDISKIEAGQLEVRRIAFDLRSSVERATASVLPLAAKKGLSLRWSVPDALPPMESDARRVEQVLINLLSNAIKFTERGEVTLTVEKIDDSARLRVTDTGIGMKEEDLSTLFQPFRQIDSGLQRQHEGTGLGLAICRRLTELLGGTIRAESERGKGSVFTVVLPMKLGEPS